MFPDLKWKYPIMTAVPAKGTLASAMGFSTSPAPDAPQLEGELPKETLRDELEEYLALPKVRLPNRNWSFVVLCWSLSLHFFLPFSLCSIVARIV